MVRRDVDTERQIARALEEQRRKHAAEIERLKRDHRVKEDASRKKQDLLERRLNQIAKVAAPGNRAKISKQARR